MTHIGGTAPGNQKYWYDANGNATRRIAGTQDVTLSYDAENRLTGMSGWVPASYVYDGDGKRVKETAGSSTTTIYVGNYYERLTYLEDFSDGLAQGWMASSGTWAVNSGGYRQSATANNTNANLAFAQAAAQIYEWTATYTSGTSAGLYLFASAATGAERGNSYRLWQDATTVKVYENVNDVATERASFPAPNPAGAGGCALRPAKPTPTR